MYEAQHRSGVETCLLFMSLMGVHVDTCAWMAAAQYNSRLCDGQLSCQAGQAR